MKNLLLFIALPISLLGYWIAVAGHYLTKIALYISEEAERW